ncbi:MAG: Rrf2 family transcriptional regulator [Actinomycetes bacterium]|jgi:Rrf2 family protein|nr:Rrf2 family transcriptional regulator [Actinomycetes bacterium]
MRISTKGRYALRVMIDLALHDNGEYIPLKDVSKRQGISVKYLEQIIPLLNKAGYLNSSRGSNGGYRLARPTDSYTAYDILQTTEGTLAPIACLENGNGCEQAPNCKVLPFYDGLNRAIVDYLVGVTLTDLVQQEKGTEVIDYQI